MSLSLELIPTLWPRGAFTHHPSLCIRLSPTQEASYKPGYSSPSATLSSKPQLSPHMFHISSTIQGSGLGSP